MLQTRHYFSYPKIWRFYYFSSFLCTVDKSRLFLTKYVCRYLGIHYICHQFLNLLCHAVQQNQTILREILHSTIHFKITLSFNLTTYHIVGRKCYLSNGAINRRPLVKYAIATNVQDTIEKMQIIEVLNPSFFYEVGCLCHWPDAMEKQLVWFGCAVCRYTFDHEKSRSEKPGSN